MAIRRRAIVVVMLWLLGACSTQSDAGDVTTTSRRDEADVAGEPITSAAAITSTTSASRPSPAVSTSSTASTVAAASAGPIPTPVTSGPAAAMTTPVGSTANATPTGRTNVCSDLLALDDADGDGWGECAPTAPLDLSTVVWWNTIGGYRQPMCDSGYDVATGASMVPGGLDRMTYEFLCTTLASADAAAPGET